PGQMYTMLVDDPLVVDWAAAWYEIQDTSVLPISATDATSALATRMCRLPVRMIAAQPAPAAARTLPECGGDSSRPARTVTPEEKHIVALMRIRVSPIAAEPLVHTDPRRYDTSVVLTTSGVTRILGIVSGRDRPRARGGQAERCV